MILYNVTIKIEQTIAAEWLEWMKTVHIPDVMATKLFTEYKICKILHDDEDGGETYAIQYFCPSMEDFYLYQKQYAKALQAEHMEKYKDRYVAFRTLMEVVE